MSKVKVPEHEHRKQKRKDRFKNKHRDAKKRDRKFYKFTKSGRHENSCDKDCDDDSWWGQNEGILR